MQRLVLPLALGAALVAGVMMAQLEKGPSARNVQTASALGMCLATGIGCAR